MALQEEFEKQGNFLFRYRSYFPLIILVIGLGLYIFKEVYPENFILSGTPYEIYYEMFALFIGLLGLVVRIYTVGHTPKNTSGRNTKEGQVADSLNTTGIYSTVRHPLYVGNFLMWLAPAMLTGNFWFIIAFCLFYWVYYERIMFAEEQFLRGKFGETYLNWAANVNAFIPNFKNFKKPNMPFSWKKVLKKEKNGLFALFLIFCAFDILGEVINERTDYNYFLIGMCLITGLSYIVLKLIKDNSSLLQEDDR
jgi:protein-S-isoprenylcysteine O-methyltransferase Ste14